MKVKLKKRVPPVLTLVVNEEESQSHQDFPGAPHRIKDTPEPLSATFSAKRTAVKSGVWDLHRDGVTQGFLASWKLCHEKARLGAVEGLVLTKQGAALGIGNIVHDVLDKLYTAVAKKEQSVKRSDKQKFDRLGFAEAMMKAILTEKESADRKALNERGGAQQEEIQLLEESYGIAEGILPGYLKRWEEDFEEADWVELEEVFDFEVEVKGTKLRMRGKRDGVYRSKKSSRLYLFETKTKGQVKEDSMMDRLVFDFQVMFYLWAMWKKYEEVPAGVVYNIIRRPMLRKGATESQKQFLERVRKDTLKRPEFYYIRFQSSIVVQDLRRFEEELMSMLEQLIDWYNGKFHWRNADACSHGGFDCQFLAVCARGDLMKFRKKEDPFPELKGENEE